MPVSTSATITLSEPVVVFQAVGALMPQVPLSPHWLPLVKSGSLGTVAIWSVCTGLAYCTAELAESCWASAAMSAAGPWTS